MTVVLHEVPRQKPDVLSAIVGNIPSTLRQHDRWLVWTLDGAGKKVPRSITKPSANIDANRASNWSSFDQFMAAPQKLNGPGFALGAIDGGPTFAGIDLDKCRNPLSQAIEPWAREIVSECDSYTEVSPSGTGVKIFLLGTLPDDLPQDKVFKLEIYDRKRYFTVTGHHLAGTPRTVNDREQFLRSLHARQRSNDLADLTKLFGFYLQQRGSYIDITCPWFEDHSGSDSPRDAALHFGDDGAVDGFHCFHASHADTKTLRDVLTFFGIKGGHSGFVLNAKGLIVPGQENIRRALDKLGVTVRRDLFAQKPLITSGDKTMPLDNDNAILTWLAVDHKFGFLPPKDFFFDVVQDAARRHPFHPVRDYLDGLTWDGTPRIDEWLSSYGRAKSTPFNRAAGSIILKAAVKRVRQPGCKVDEMLVLISPQGTDKSSALRALCPNEAWFSDDLPLNVDAKQIIERTSGKWIIEAAELNGFGKRETDHLKASLSRQVDGPVRLAYGRLPVEVPRQFVMIGTTNTHQFLKDKTGNRRFWPVAVKQFDVAALKRDRDQLWAEAAQREAAGESIRLDQSLWAKAAQEQDARQIDDPWRSILGEALGLDESDGGHTPADRLDAETVWAALGISVERRDERQAERVNAVMQSLGYEKKQSRGFGADKRSTKRWCRVSGQSEFADV